MNHLGKIMKQLEELNQNDIIPKVTGKITKLWPAKEREGKFGPYKIQGGDIEIDGDIYGITFMDKEQNPDVLKGKVVTISSTKGKMGLGGVELSHESYSKSDGTKVDRDCIKVKKTAKVELAGGEAIEEPVSATRETRPARQTEGDPKKAIDSIVEMHIYIDGLVRHAYAGRASDEETLRSYVASVFIEANRKGISYAVASEPPKPACDPKDWGAAIVPSGSMKGKTLGSVGKPALTKLYQHYLEKGFECPFSKCVEQAGNDLQLGGDLTEEVQDDIPW
jgi:hypothetical protein